MSAPPPPENPIIVNIMSSYGSLLIGSFLSQAVWGISTMQTFLYYKNYDADHPLLKLLVAILWGIDTADQILILKGNFRVLVLQYGRIAGLSENQRELIYHTWLEAILVFVVQMYFIRRIYLFGRQYKIISVFCAILALLSSWQLIGIIIYWVLSYGKPLAEQAKPHIVNLNVSLRAAAVVVDVLVAMGMVWLLTRAGTPHFSRTKKMMFRILMLTINSGTWTALIAFIVLILLKTTSTTLEYCTLEYTLCSLYFSTFLANLNARNYIKGDGGEVTSLSTLEIATDPRTNTTLILRPTQNTVQSNSVTSDSDGGKGITVYTDTDVYINSVTSRTFSQDPHRISTP